MAAIARRRLVVSRYLERRPPRVAALVDSHAAASGVGRGGAISQAGFGDGGEEAAAVGRWPPPQPRSELRKDDTDLERAVGRERGSV